MESQGLNTTRRGSYFIHSSIAYLNLTISEVDEAVSFYNQLLEGKINHAQSNSLVTLSRLSPALVLGHERNHFQQLMTTPFGMLVWRIMNTISSAEGFLVRTLRHLDACNQITLPITDWFFGKGTFFFEKHPASISDFNKTQKPRPLGSVKSDILNNIEYVFHEVRVLKNFLQAILGSSELTMLEFVQLANEATKYLVFRSDLNVHLEWNAHNLTASSYLPQEGFDALEILESGARKWERGSLIEIYKSSKVNPQELIIAWENQAIYGLCEPVYSWISEELNDTFLSQMAIDISMMTPIDLWCAPIVSNQLFVEDVLPSWRLIKIVDIMKNTYWQYDAEWLEFQTRAEIADRANLIPPWIIAKTGSEVPISGVRAWTNDEIIHDVPVEMRTSNYCSFVEYQMSEALRNRYTNSLGFIEKRTGIFMPIFEIFKDSCNIRRQNLATQKGVITIFNAYRTLVMNIALHSLLYAGDVSDLKILERSFINRVESWGIEQNSSIWSVKNILISLLGVELFDILCGLDNCKDEIS